MTPLEFEDGVHRAADVAIDESRRVLVLRKMWTSREVAELLEVLSKKMRAIDELDFEDEAHS